MTRYLIIVSALVAIVLPKPSVIASGATATNRPWTACGGLSTHPSSLLFVPNHGQFDPRVRFQARSAEGIWWFMEREVWLSHPKAVNLRLTFPGLSPTARLAPAEPQVARMNYFLGPDPDQRRSNVPTFAALRWEGVLPGLNLLFAARGESMSITVEPDLAGFQNQSSLQVKIEGAESLHITSAGQILANTAIGPIPLPLIMSADDQPLTATVNRDTIFLTPPSPYHPGTLSSCPTGMLRNHPVTSSPYHSSLLYSTFLGGSAYDYSTAVAAGADGSAYVTGYTQSTDFPTTPGSFDPEGNDGVRRDAFVSRISADGSTLLYSTILGGAELDQGLSLAVGSDGAAYITGFTDSPDFPTTPNAFDTSYNGGMGIFGGDVFVTKLAADGSAILYSTYLGGSDSDIGYAIAPSPDGAISVTGYTASLNFPITPSAFQTLYAGGLDDAFVTRLDTTGEALVYSTYLGGWDADLGFGLALGIDGTTFVAGLTASADFPTTTSAFDTELANNDAFVTHLNDSGTALLYSTFLGGSSNECSSGCAIAVDPTGTAYVTGLTLSSDFPTTSGAFDRTYDGGVGYNGGDAFVSRLDTSGSALVFSTFLGSHGNECYEYAACHIAVDAHGLAYITGDTSSTDFPTTADAFDTSYNSGLGNDAFLTVLSPGGRILLYSTFLGGSADDDSYGLSLGADGAVYTSGLTESLDFPTTPGAFDQQCGCAPGLGDAYLTRWHLDLPPWPLHVASIDPRYQPSGNRYRVGTSVTIQDEDGAPVASAFVRFDITLPDGVRSSVGRNTDTSGIATVYGLETANGMYTFCVADVIKLGWEYDPAQNVETCDEVFIP